MDVERGGGVCGISAELFVVLALGGGEARAGWWRGGRGIVAEALREVGQFLPEQMVWREVFSEAFRSRRAFLRDGDDLPVAQDGAAR